MDALGEPLARRGIRRAAAITQKLGLPPYFLVGVGSDDNDAAFTFGAPIDLRYRYLVGDWRTWNSPDGAFVKISAKKAKDKGAVPMFTLYLMAGLGDGNTDIGNIFVPFDRVDQIEGGPDDPYYVGGKSAADVGAAIQKAWDEIK